MSADMREFSCDLCGSNDAQEFPAARQYTNDQPVHICNRCGFVYIRSRRSAQAIADSWSNEIYGEGYTARIPAVKARQTYVAETIDVELGLGGRAVCDIGGGEGQFLEIARAAPYQARVFAIEPSAANCAALSAAGIDNFNGTIEAYLVARPAAAPACDFVTILWTLENCMSCRDMLDGAYALLAAGGHVVVATGSRILVPFKKPLHSYLSTNPADTHAFRFSASTLAGVLAVTGFEPVFVNRYIDSDYLVVIGRKTVGSRHIPWRGDDPALVADFFRRWHEETAAHYADV